MHIQALCLEAGETVRDGLEPLAHGIEMIESLLQAEVAQVVGTEFVAQVAGEFFVLFEKGVFPVSAEDVMAVLDLIDDGGEFSVVAGLWVSKNYRGAAAAGFRDQPQTRAAVDAGGQSAVRASPCLRVTSES